MTKKKTCNYFLIYMKNLITASNDGDTNKSTEKGTKILINDLLKETIKSSHKQCELILSFKNKKTLGYFVLYNFVKSLTLINNEQSVELSNLILSYMNEKVKNMHKENKISSKHNKSELVLSPCVTNKIVKEIKSENSILYKNYHIGLTAIVEYIMISVLRKAIEYNTNNGKNRLRNEDVIFAIMENPELSHIFNVLKVKVNSRYNEFKLPTLVLDNFIDNNYIKSSNPENPNEGFIDVVDTGDKVNPYDHFIDVYNKDRNSFSKDPFEVIVREKLNEFCKVKNYQNFRLSSGVVEFLMEYMEDYMINFLRLAYMFSNHACRIKLNHQDVKAASNIVRGFTNGFKFDYSEMKYGKICRKKNKKPQQDEDEETSQSLMNEESSIVQEETEIQDTESQVEKENDEFIENFDINKVKTIKMDFNKNTLLGENINKQLGEEASWDEYKKDQYEERIKNINDERTLDDEFSEYLSQVK